MEKLGQLRAQADRRRHGWDLVVVDTPPSRSALDFLDAPERLGSFLDGRLIRLLSAPARAGGRAYLQVVAPASGGDRRADQGAGRPGADRRPDSSSPRWTRCSAASGSGPTRRTSCCKAPGTAFVVVAAPERDALREASYFVERLAAEGMPLAGLVLNRVHDAAPAALSAERSVAAAESWRRRAATT